MWDFHRNVLESYKTLLDTLKTVWESHIANVGLKVSKCLSNDTLKLGWYEFLGLQKKNLK